MKMKKAAALCLAGMTAISSLAVGVSAEEEKVTITVGNWPTEDRDDYEKSEAIRAAFMESHPNIIVETDTYQYSTDTFLAKAASGQLPDVYPTYFTETEKIINAGYAQDITDAFNASEYVGTVNEDIMELICKDDRIYGIPLSGYSLCLYCNVELFKEAGLVDEEGLPTLPTTWEEVAEYASIIKEKTGKGGFALPSTDNTGGWLFTNIAWAFGAEFEEQIDGNWTAAFDSEEGVAALQYVKDLKWEYDAMPEDCLMSLNDWMNSYGTDQVAMGLCHVGVKNSIVSLTGMSKDNMAITAVPEGPAGRYTLMGGDVYMIAPGTTEEQQEAILEWILYSSSSPSIDEAALESFETSVSINAENGYPVGPTGLEIWENAERVEKEQEIRDKYTNVDMRLWNGYCEHASEGLKAEPPVNAQELYAVFDALIQEVLTNEDADCQTLLTQAASNFQSDYLDNAN